MAHSDGVKDMFLQVQEWWGLLAAPEAEERTREHIPLRALKEHSPAYTSTLDSSLCVSLSSLLYVTVRILKTQIIIHMSGAGSERALVIPHPSQWKIPVFQSIPLKRKIVFCWSLSCSSLVTVIYRNLFQKQRWDISEERQMATASSVHGLTNTASKRWHNSLTRNLSKRLLEDSKIPIPVNLHIILSLSNKRPGSELCTVLIDISGTQYLSPCPLWLWHWFIGGIKRDRYCSGNEIFQMLSVFWRRNCFQSCK